MYDITEILHHLGEEELPFNAVSPPIFQTSIFSFGSFDDFARAMADEQSRFIYSRGNNPTVNLVEQKIAALEHGERAKLVSSGSSAISHCIAAFVGSGDHIVAVRDCYSWANHMMSGYLPRFGVETSYVDGSDPAEFEAAIRPNTKLIYLESPTTLTFKLQDLAAVAAIARKRGIKTVIDNTWCTPLYQNPIDFGIDLVLHSVSKYLGGHSDVVAGAIVGSERDISHIFSTEFQQFGTVPDPFMAWLVLRGMRTLNVRMPAHDAAGRYVAAFLAGHPAVESVLHPFLPSFPQAALVARQMRGGASLFSFRLKTRDLSRVRTFVDSLTLFKRAVSWGGYESLVFPNAVCPFPGGVVPEDRVSLIRLHVGLEDKDMIVRDLERALAAMEK
jgi:cystathionine beta-lyase/cystathionine gamma-synthase